MAKCWSKSFHITKNKPEDKPRFSATPHSPFILQTFMLLLLLVVIVIFVAAFAILIRFPYSYKMHRYNKVYYECSVYYIYMDIVFEYKTP